MFAELLLTCPGAALLSSAPLGFELTVGLIEASARVTFIGAGHNSTRLASQQGPERTIRSLGKYQCDICAPKLESLLISPWWLTAVHIKSPLNLRLTSHVCNLRLKIFHSKSVELLQRIFFFIMTSRLTGSHECHGSDILKEQCMIFHRCQIQSDKKCYVKLSWCHLMWGTAWHRTPSRSGDMEAFGVQRRTHCVRMQVHVALCLQVATSVDALLLV